MRAHNPNGTSIGSAIFAQMTAECLYTLQWFACFPSKLSLPMLASGPHLMVVHWAHPSPERKWQLDRFSRFCRADRLTERQTDRQTTLLSAMQRNNA